MVLRGHHQNKYVQVSYSLTPYSPSKTIHKCSLYLKSLKYSATRLFASKNTCFEGETIWNTDPTRFAGMREEDSHQLLRKVTKVEAVCSREPLKNMLVVRKIKW